MKSAHWLSGRGLPLLLGCVIGLNALLPAPAAAQGGAGDLPEDAEESPVDLSTPEKMLNYLSRHRRDVALVSYSVRPDGTVDQDDPVVMHNADVPMPLASTMKVVLLAAYAREVARGRLNRSEEITLRDWERNYLPGTDGGAHAGALAALTALGAVLRFWALGAIPDVVSGDEGRIGALGLSGATTSSSSSSSRCATPPPLWCTTSAGRARSAAKQEASTMRRPSRCSGGPAAAI
jgi:hypothetical protein